MDRDDDPLFFALWNREFESWRASLEKGGKTPPDKLDSEAASMALETANAAFDLLEANPGLYASRPDLLEEAADLAYQQKLHRLMLAVDQSELPPEYAKWYQAFIDETAVDLERLERELWERITAIGEGVN
jgi:hypothetical protein